MMKVLVLFLGLASTANEPQLTPDNWEAETAGKTVFLKFFAPWCGQCKKTAPDWDRMMEEYADNADQLVAEFSCVGEYSKTHCDTLVFSDSVTFKWGDASDLQDYQGGRDYNAFKAFVEENLKPMCSPKKIDLCDDNKAEISKYQGMSAADLDAAITAEETKLEDAESEFKAAVQQLQDKYQALNTEKDDTLAAVKASGLGLMKAVKGAASAGSDEL